MCVRPKQNLLPTTAAFFSSSYIIYIYIYSICYYKIILGCVCKKCSNNTKNNVQTSLSTSILLGISLFWPLNCSMIKNFTMSTPFNAYASCKMASQLLKSSDLGKLDDHLIKVGVNSKVRSIKKNKTWIFTCEFVKPKWWGYFSLEFLEISSTISAIEEVFSCTNAGKNQIFSFSISKTRFNAFCEKRIAALIFSFMRSQSWLVVLSSSLVLNFENCSRFVDIFNF